MHERYAGLSVAVLASLLAPLCLGDAAGTRYGGGREGLSREEIAFARRHLGGAALAALVKGGDPDGGGPEAVTGPTRGDGGVVLGAEEERAARRAFPAQAI